MAVWPASWRWAQRPTPVLPLPAGDKALDGYSKKKYVCKLLFIFLLGHDIDFGHMEAVNLLSSNRYTEKQIVSARRGAASHRGPWRLAPALHLRLSGDFPRFRWELTGGHRVPGAHPRGRGGTLPPLSARARVPPHPPLFLIRAQVHWFKSGGRVSAPRPASVSAPVSAAVSARV